VHVAEFIALTYYTAQSNYPIAEQLALHIGGFRADVIQCIALSYGASRSDSPNQGAIGPTYRHFQGLYR